MSEKIPDDITSPLSSNIGEITAGQARAYRTVDRYTHKYCTGGLLNRDQDPQASPDASREDR